MSSLPRHNTYLDSIALRLKHMARTKLPHGLCTRCGVEPHRPGRILCQSCADVALVEAAIRRKRRSDT